MICDLRGTYTPPEHFLVPLLVIVLALAAKEIAVRNFWVAGAVLLLLWIAAVLEIRSYLRKS
jgi:hypothetical protein